jgi:hypothetical protein
MKNKQLVYMKDLSGNNLRVFNSIFDASEYLQVEHFDLLKHIYGCSPIDNLNFKFEIKEYREL